MKRRFLSFLRKYWFCILLSVIMVFGISLSTIYADLYISGDVDDMLRFDLRDVYLVFCLPLYSLIYGCLSFLKTRKILLQQLILYIVSFLYWFRFDIGELLWPGTYLWSIFPVVFSLIGTLFTALVCYIVKSAKEYNG
ncbi:MAG: hypothetical protein E7593_02610 [Ruminococcaceae bacterium]|nr:hypothetical protein [Oscillospiraceae bacterium]